MKRAIVAIEDKRFYTESGVDVKGIARAFLNDVTGSSTTQGASTITEQLVKVIRNAEFHRTIFEKLTEAALAFQLAPQVHEGRDPQRRTSTTSTTATAPTASRPRHRPTSATTRPRPCTAAATPQATRSTLCVEQLTAAEAALLAGLVQNPPINWSQTGAAYFKTRRDQVLYDMWQQELPARERVRQRIQHAAARSRST